MTKMKEQKIPSFGTNAPSVKLDYCSSCGEEKEVNRYFYKSNNPVHRGHTLVCKDCIKKRIYRDDGKVNKQEMKDVLKEIDLPFFEDTYQRALNNDSETFGVYIRMLNPLIKSKGKKFLTWEDGETGEEIPNGLKKMDLDGVEKFYSIEWMGNYTKHELEYLDNYYRNLQNDFKIITTNHKDYARKIAQASLAVNKAYQDMINGDSGADKRYKDLQETFDKLSKSAQFSENSRSANDVGISGISQVVDKIESKQWIYEVEDFPKDSLDHLLEQFSNIGKSL